MTPMAGQEPPAADDSGQRHGQDRDTEPLPRARATFPGDDDLSDETDRFDDSVDDSSSFASDYDLLDEEEDIALSFSDEEFGGLREAPAPTTFSSRRIMPLEDEPTKLIARYLFPTEKFRGEWKHHWIQIFRELVGAVAVTALMGYLTGLAALKDRPSMVTIVIVAWGCCMVFFAWRIADWYVDRFILTNKRVMVVKGLITRNVGMMPLLRVTDMKYVQSPMGRLLGYGTFELESAGQDQALSKVKNLPNPNELYLRIVEEMYEPEAVEARLSRGAEEADGT